MIGIHPPLNPPNPKNGRKRSLSDQEVSQVREKYSQRILTKDQLCFRYKVCIITLEDALYGRKAYKNV